MQAEQAEGDEAEYDDDDEEGEEEEEESGLSGDESSEEESASDEEVLERPAKKTRVTNGKVSCVPHCTQLQLYYTS